MYIIKQNTKQDGGVSPLLIQKEFLQNRFSNYIFILQQQPTDVFSEIVLQGLLLNKIEKKQAVDYLLQSDPTRFAYQYAQHCLSFQFPPILKLIFLVSHHQFLEHSLNIVVKNQITKRELMTVPLNYSGDISVQELESIISAYPKFNQLASLYLKLNPKFDQFNNIFISQIKRSELFQKNVETLLNYLLECDDKQAITQILLSLNFYNDTIINLGILMSTDEMQQKEEQLYFEKWTSTKVFKKKIWYRFSVLVQQHLIRLENMEFIVQNLNFQYPLLIKALFSLVRRHTSNFIIENAASPDIIKYSNYFLVFPDFFKVFFIDFAQFQDEDYNNLILKSLSVTLTHLEKTKTQQEVFNLKSFLCQFLLQCAQKMEDKTEINIYQFLQQLLIKDKHLILQFVSDLKLDQIEKAVKNIDCLHIVSADLNLLSEKVQNKEKLLKFCQSLQRKHKRELVDKILEQYSNEKAISISTNQIMAKKEDKLIVQFSIKQTKQVSDILNKIQDYYRNQSQTKAATKKFNISRQNISNKILYLQQFEKKLEEVTALNIRKSMVLPKFKEYESVKQEQKDIATILKEKQKIPKTRICRQFIKTQQCRMGQNCKYAHSIKELDVEYAPIAWTIQFEHKRPQTMGSQRPKYQSNIQ